MRAIVWARTAFWAGAGIDALVTVLLLMPTLLTRTLGLRSAPENVDVRLALIMTASLMAGWTVLLLWAAQRPFERRAILLLTVVPVIAGLAIAVGYGWVQGYIPLTSALAIWVPQTMLSGMFLVAYVVTAGRRLGRPAT